MKLFNSILFGSIIIVNTQASSLKEVLQSTLKNNENLKALALEDKGKYKLFSSAENIYLPRLDMGVNYVNLDIDKRDIQIGQTTNAYVKFRLNIYDAGKNKALRNQKMYEYQASTFNTIINKKSTALQVVTLFFQIKTLQDNIKVYREKGLTLKAQYEKVKSKYDMKMLTIDEVFKLQSEYESNRYVIEELKYQEKELFQNISLLSNSHITSLDDSKLPEVKNISFNHSEAVKSLKLTIKAIEENSKVIASANKLQVNIEDMLSLYDYKDYNEQVLRNLPVTQNQFSFILSYSFYDTFTKDKIESAQLSVLATKQKLQYEQDKEKVIFDLAKQKLKTQKLKIDSLKSAVEMGNSVYDIVSIKFQNGLVDNISYLDALSRKTYNESLYQKALNDYEIAKANYYFSSGIDYKQVIKAW